MNVKLHTPNTLKTGSGLSSTKQFLLSLIATTVSIVLTFGTAAVIDHHKKEAAKKEMVMMVINDYDKTIAFLERADSSLRLTSNMQQELAIHPERFDSLRFRLPITLTWLFEDYSETTEKIFTTSIETFNTIGDVNFVNEVSSFYLSRHKYREFVFEKLKDDMETRKMLNSLKSLMDVSFPEYVYLNWSFLEEMKGSRDRCMRMMHVSEKDVSKFSKKLEEEVNPAEDAKVMKMLKELDSCNSIIEQARQRLED